MTEPTHTGISYSFTADGYYEEAYYRAVANRTYNPSPHQTMNSRKKIRGLMDFSLATTPSCPQAIMQWQHGTFVENSTGSLILTPFSVDGRQLQSDPCSYKHSVYTRYNQTETIKVLFSLSLLLKDNRRLTVEIVLPSIHRRLHKTNQT